MRLNIFCASFWLLTVLVCLVLVNLKDSSNLRLIYSIIHFIEALSTKDKMSVFYTLMFLFYFISWFSSIELIFSNNLLVWGVCICYFSNIIHNEVE